MIDQELIIQETFNIQTAIKSRTSTVVPGLWTCHNVLGTEAIDKLRTFINTADSTLWQTVDNQETLNRRKITWQTDSIIEEIHTAFDANTDLINLLWPEQKKKFLGIQLWKDWTGYSLPWHADNDLIDLSMQIYLFDAPSSLGTVFQVNDCTVEIPYQHNTGYFAKNSKSLLHRTAQTTPIDVTRYSLYAVWSHC